MSSMARRQSEGRRPPPQRQRTQQWEGIQLRRSTFVGFLLLAAATTGQALLLFTREQAFIASALVVPLVALEPATKLHHLAWSAVTVAGSAGLYLGEPDGDVGNTGHVNFAAGAIALLIKTWLFGVVAAVMAERRSLVKDDNVKGALVLARAQTAIAGVGACALAVALSPGLPAFDLPEFALVGYTASSAASDVLLYLLLTLTGPVYASVAQSVAACLFILFERLRPPVQGAPFVRFDQLGAVAVVAAAVGLYYLARFSGGQGFLQADVFSYVTSPTTTTAPQLNRRHARTASSISGLKPQWGTSVSDSTTPTMLRLSAGGAICTIAFTLLTLGPSSRLIDPGSALYVPDLYVPEFVSLPRDTFIHPAGSTGAVVGQGEDFGAYLKKHIPTSESRVIWLTVADANYARSAVPHLSTFLDNINANAPTLASREELVVLCLDVECVQECQKWRVYAFAGFSFTVDPRLHPSNNDARLSVWVKLNGIHEALRAGYSVVFADGDVFFRSDPREYMLPLSDPSWDLQIQHEGARHAVNIGFFFQRASPTNVLFWEQVLDKMLEPTKPWDQEVVNELLDTWRLRDPPVGKPPLDEFTSPHGLKVKVFPGPLFWGNHMGHMFWEESTLMHMTCSDSTYLKFFVAAAYGAFADVNEYYTSPPRILIAPPLAGTAEEILDTLRLTIATAQLTDRAIILPLQASYLGPRSKADPDGFSPSFDIAKNETLFVHRPYTWSVAPLEQIEKHYNVSFLEPSYIEHAAKHLAFFRPDILLELSTVATLDLHPIWNWDTLVNRITSPVFDDKLVVRLSTNEGPRGFWSHYRDWDLPEAASLDRLRLCRHIEDPITCFLCSGSTESDFFDPDMRE